MSTSPSTARLFWPAVLAGWLVAAGVGLLVADATAGILARWLRRAAGRRPVRRG